jgi:uncharacterized protein YndB with AHSA1/START domain
MQNAEKVNLELEKECNVPIDRLYKAWINEEDLRQWWRPMDNTLKRMANDMKVGGIIEYAFENAEGQEAFVIKGNYKEVEEGSKLIYTWNWQLPAPTIHDSSYILTVSFSEEGNGSKIHIKQDQFKNEENLQPHREGWEKALESLKLYVENGA